MLTDRDRMRLERQRDALITEVRGLGNLMRGSVVQVAVKCGRPGCACAQGAKHRKVHLSVNLGGRTRGCYLGGIRHNIVDGFYVPRTAITSLTVRSMAPTDPGELSRASSAANQLDPLAPSRILARLSHCVSSPCKVSGSIRTAPTVNDLMAVTP